MYFGNLVQLRKCKTDSISVARDTILRSNFIRYLGMWLDANLSFKIHMGKKCQAVMGNLLKIRSIRHLLDTDTATSLCVSLCISHLDKGHTLLYGLPESSIKTLQRIQNICVRLGLRRHTYQGTTKCLKILHWLLIKEKIKFKILILVYKCRHNEGPPIWLIY